MNTEVKISNGSKSENFLPQLQSTLVKNTATVWLEKGSLLAPGNNKKIQDKTIKLNVPIDFIFYKTKLSSDRVPPYFNLTHDFKFNQRMKLLND